MEINNGTIKEIDMLHREDIILKHMMVYAGGFLLLTTCMNGAGSTTYGVDNEEAENEEDALLAANAYQVTMDDSFERLSNYEGGEPDQRMFFWQEEMADEFDFNLDTTQLLREEVPTIEINPINKYEYIFLHDYLDFDHTEEEALEVKEKVKQDVEEGTGTHLEDIKDTYIRRIDEEVTVSTNEENNIDPFTYMVKHETEAGTLRYELFGEAEEDYIQATLTIPSTEEENEALFETMLGSLQSITFDTEEFDDNAVMKETPARLAYEPSNNLLGEYPEVGYSFNFPEAATFRGSYPAYHVYRYTFGTPYEETVEKESDIPRSSDLVVRAEKLENAPTREEEIRNRAAEDFVGFGNNYVRTIDYLHEEEDFDTGIFTTAVRAEYDGYEEYWFLKEIDGHVYKVFFDLTFDTEEYDDLREDYLDVVQSFEITDVEE